MVVPSEVTELPADWAVAVQGPASVQHTLRTVLGWGLAVAVWELAGRTGLAGRHLIGVPSGIVAKLVANAEVYGRALWFTASEAVPGYLLGNLAAVALALLVVLLPGLERMVLRVALVVYCLPLVALGPLLRLVYGFGDGPQVTLAAFAVFYLTLVPLLVGLRAMPRSWLDLTATYGRGRWTTLVTVRARAALPYLMAGLQASVPAAFLGALVGEFTGAERGVGVLSILALRSLDTDGLWALMLLSTVASLAGFAGVASLPALGVLGALAALPLKVVSSPKGLRELTSDSKRMASGRSSDSVCPVSTSMTFFRIETPSLNRMKTSAPFSRSGRLAVESSHPLKCVVTSHSPVLSRSQRK